MKVKKVLVSQPKPTSEKSPYYEIAEKYGVEIDFRPFIKVEGLSAKEFRQSRITISDFTAVIFTARTAVDHFFRLCEEMRYTVPDTMKYFCTTESVANYLQKYILYRKRKIFFVNTGKIDDLLPYLLKHNKERFLYAISNVHKEDLNILDHNNINYTKAVMYRTVSNDFGPGCFRSTTAQAVRDAGLRLDMEAPTTNAPSMTAALDLFLKEDAAQEA